MAQRQFRTDDTSLWTDRFGGGGDGALTVSGDSTHSAANSGCSGTASTTSLTLDAASTFADGDLVIIHQSRGTGVGAWELNKIASGGGGTSLVMSYSLINTYTDSGASQAQILELKEYSSVTVNGSVTYSASDWDGNKGGVLAFLCNGTVTVTGNISATGKGYRGGAGGVSNSTGGSQGEGTTGAGGVDGAANGNGGGGGRFGGIDSVANSAAGGGHSAAATNGPVHSEGGPDGPTASSGGESAGVAGLTTAVFGGGGGGGGRQGNTAGAGADGGGFVLIIAKTITITGTIPNNGSSSSQINTNHDGAGGGGAGGSTLLKGQVLDIGTNKLTCTLGAGAWGCAIQHSNLGSNGTVGRAHIDWSQSLTGSASDPSVDSSQDLILNDLPLVSTDNYTLLM